MRKVIARIWFLCCVRMKGNSHDLLFFCVRMSEKGNSQRFVSFCVRMREKGTRQNLVSFCVRMSEEGMGWLRLIGLMKLQVSFAEYILFYRALLQKRPKI